MVKVGFLSPGLVLGGAERWSVSLARHCDPSRIQFIGTALTEWSNESPVLTQEMARYMPIYGTPVSPDSPTHDHKHVRRPGPDASQGISIVASQAQVMIAWTWMKLGVMLNYYRKHYGVKVVCVSHTDMRNMYAAVQNDADYLTAVSKAAANGYKQTDKPIEVIANGADVERCVPMVGRDAFRAKYGISPNDIVLTYIGRFSNEKNPLMTAQVAAHFGKPFKALYVGGGSLLGGCSDAEWLPQLKEIGKDQLHFVGPQHQLGDALAASDVVLSCSMNEGFSLSIAETWLAGVPLVATQVGSIPEIEAIHGPMCQAIPKGAGVAEVAGAVTRALSPRNHAIPIRARDVAWNNYTAPAMAERWMQFIERIADAKTT